MRTRVLTVDQVSNWARLKAAEALADAVDRLLAGIGTRDALQQALFAYWRTVPPGPEKAWTP